MRNFLPSCKSIEKKYFFNTSHEKKKCFSHKSDKLIITYNFGIDKTHIENEKEIFENYF